MAKTKVKGPRPQRSDEVFLHPDTHGDRSGESFGEAIFRIRTTRGIAQSAIAARARLSAGYFSELENGKRLAPPAATAQRIAQALGGIASEAEQLVALADAERAAALHDSHLPPAVRDLVARIRAAAPNLTAECVASMHAALGEKCM